MSSQPKTGKLSQAQKKEKEATQIRKEKARNSSRGSPARVAGESGEKPLKFVCKGRQRRANSRARWVGHRVLRVWSAFFEDSRHVTFV